MGRLTPSSILGGNIPILGSAIRYEAVQSANPQDLEAKVQAVVDALIAGDEEQIVDIDIEGAGDGHTFIVSFLLASGSAPAAGSIVRVWMGANRLAFQNAFTTLMSQLVEAGDPLEILGHGTAGGDQGSRFCGLLLLQPVPA